MPIIIPTTLTKEQVENFQKLYFERFKEKINFEEAERIGLQLVQFMAYVFQLVGADFSSQAD